MVDGSAPGDDQPAHQCRRQGDGSAANAEAKRPPERLPGEWDISALHGITEPVRPAPQPRCAQRSPA